MAKKAKHRKKGGIKFMSVDNNVNRNLGLTAGLGRIDSVKRLVTNNEMLPGDEKHIDVLLQPLKVGEGTWRPGRNGRKKIRRENGLKR